MTLYSIAAHYLLARTILVCFISIAIHDLLGNLLANHVLRYLKLSVVESQADGLLQLIVFTSSLLMLMHTR